MKQHLNTLFVTTPGAYLKKEGQTVAVRVDKQTRLHAPLHHLGGIVAFGAVGASPALMAACAKAGISISFLNRYGSFLARVLGFTTGNVLLRRAQYRRADDDSAALDIARLVVLAKISNSRTALMRAARDRPDAPGRELLIGTARRLHETLHDVRLAENVDALRGLEGDAAKSYFSVFNEMITADSDEFVMNGRTRRPPLDRVNASAPRAARRGPQAARGVRHSIG